MRAADTNVLVRLFTGDEPAQVRAAEKFLHDCTLAREEVFVSAPVLCELAWVLRGYGVSKPQMIELLATLLAQEIFRIDREAAVLAAVDRYKNGKGDFADYLIGAIAEDAGCRDTVTFDQALKGAPGFTIL